jgi:uncharacterized protein YegP (UPF0339 family)
MATEDRIEVYEAADGWRWRRVAGNNEKLSSGEQHRDRTDAERAARRANPDLYDEETP